MYEERYLHSLCKVRTNNIVKNKKSTQLRVREDFNTVFYQINFDILKMHVMVNPETTCQNPRWLFAAFLRSALA